MNKRITQAERSGKDLGKCIIQVISLLDKSRTRKDFYKGLIGSLYNEFLKQEKRKKK